ncbi:MAG: LCP family protein [Defluviitaleaceae bacterium]|nr:LCP family protein [Defluviitaleaceae bacterium]MCL2273522.1 LCP family protein [Defluviitaleaceae bacterium]
MVAGIVAGSYLILATAFVMVALAMDNRRIGDLQLSPPAGEIVNSEYDTNPVPEHFLTPPVIENEDTGSLWRPPARTNFIMLGIDNLQLADAIMVGTFYRDTGEVRLMSVPRDTYIVLSDARHAQIRALGLNMPQRMKLNELRSFGGSTWGAQLVAQELSDMLGVTFQYHVEVRLPAFRRVVDAIGGVYFTVPRRLFYVDPCQDLVIDVPAGHQRLNGTLAEGLVRYRGYGNADLGRNSVQMDFMTALLNQVLTREAIMNNPLELLSTVIQEVSTNMTIPSMVRYLPYITSASADRVYTFTMPGVGGYRRGAGSVFLPDLATLHDVTREVFFANAEDTPAYEDEADPEDEEVETDEPTDEAS